MSREFGSYYAGYFHAQIETAAADCQGGRCEITRLWGALLAAMEPVAYGIASAEAHDSGEAHPIEETIRALPGCRTALQRIAEYIRPFEDVARHAVAQALREREESAAGGGG